MNGLAENKDDKIDSRKMEWKENHDENIDFKNQTKEFFVKLVVLHCNSATPNQLLDDENVNSYFFLPFTDAMTTNKILVEQIS